MLQMAVDLYWYSYYIFDWMTNILKNYKITSVPKTLCNNVYYKNIV